jgi:transposase
MKLLYRRCAGIDVHQKSVSVCVRRRVKGQPNVEREEAVFGTFTQDLERLGQWLKERKVTQVAMESTGVYWIPVWNVLEQAKWKLSLLLVNPMTVRALRGQKTDRIDARRLAEFLQYGLLKGSFIPPKPVRQLRDLTRLRAHLQQDRNRVINRIGRLLETVNIKLGAVASHIAGKSGRAILRQLAEGSQDAEKLSQLALGLLKKKAPDLILALDGRPDEHFRWMLTRLLTKLERLDGEVAELDARLCEQMQPYEEILDRLSTIPGVKKTAARVLIAELGVDMAEFPSAGHLASWAGLCPGNAESAGKRFSGRTRKGDRYVRRVLVQCAWAASRAEDCFLAALFQRLAPKLGPKKAAVAVAHRILVIVWSLLRKGTCYQERGGNHFDLLHPERTARRLLKRLDRMGIEVRICRRGRPPGSKNRKKLLFEHDSGIAPRLPLPDVMPEDACRKCWNAGLPRCIHLIKRKKKLNPALALGNSDTPEAT